MIRRARREFRIDLAQHLGGQRPHVDPLQDGDPVVAAEALMQLTVPDVDGVDLRRPALEEAVGEATGGRARIERRAGRSTSTAKRVEGGIELLAAPADEAGRRAEELDGLVGRHQAGRLVGR